MAVNDWCLWQWLGFRRKKKKKIYFFFFSIIFIKSGRFWSKMRFWFNLFLVVLVIKISQKRPTTH